MGKTFVGFGFGPIQSALFLFEAFMSGNFSRYVVAEVDASLVQALRRNGGAYTVNIARKGRTDQVVVRGVELYNPAVEEDRSKLVNAVSQAHELATALPSVNFFDMGGRSSVAQILAEGIGRRDGLPGVLYAAENHNHAAEILTENVRKYASASVLKSFQFLNTVVGKMSGVIGEADAIKQLTLTTMTPTTPRAILVEEFNRILVSRITLPNFKRGIEVFLEKDDLLPFEEAKLYGHNAIHALMGYLCDLRGLQAMSQAVEHPDIMATAREAFIGESGAALIRKHASLNDPLFTPDGYRDYADDLLERMVRPNLNDLIVRVTRDHVRKLGYDDRLFGTMRVALRQGITPSRLAQGAAAAVISMIRHPEMLKSPPASLPKNENDLTEASLAALLQEVWGGKSDELAQSLIDLTWQGIAALRRG